MIQDFVGDVINLFATYCMTAWSNGRCALLTSQSLWVRFPSLVRDITLTWIFFSEISTFYGVLRQINLVDDMTGPRDVR